MSYCQFALQLSFALCEGIEIPESKKIFACGIRNPKFLARSACGIHNSELSIGIWNTAQGIRNPTKNYNPESKFPSTLNPESTAWNPEYKTLLGDLLTATERLQAICHATSVAGKVGWKDPKFPTHPLERSALSQIR